MTTPEQIKSWIEIGLPGAAATITGDGAHFEAVIVYDEFADKSLLKRQQMVYNALGDKMQSAIHALSMKTIAPGENK